MDSNYNINTEDLPLFQKDEDVVVQITDIFRIMKKILKTHYRLNELLER